MVSLSPSISSSHPSIATSSSQQTGSVTSWSNVSKVQVNYLSDEPGGVPSEVMRISPRMELSEFIKMACLRFYPSRYQWYYASKINVFIKDKGYLVDSWYSYANSCMDLPNIRPYHHIVLEDKDKIFLISLDQERLIPEFRISPILRSQMLVLHPSFIKDKLFEYGSSDCREAISHIFALKAKLDQGDSNIRIKLITDLCSDHVRVASINSPQLVKRFTSISLINPISNSILQTYEFNRIDHKLFTLPIVIQKLVFSHLAIKDVCCLSLTCKAILSNRTPFSYFKVNNKNAENRLFTTCDVLFSLCSSYLDLKSLFHLRRTCKFVLLNDTNLQRTVKQRESWQLIRDIFLSRALYTSSEQRAVMYNFASKGIRENPQPVRQQIKKWGDKMLAARLNNDWASLYRSMRQFQDQVYNWCDIKHSPFVENTVSLTIDWREICISFCPAINKKGDISDVIWGSVFEIIDEIGRKASNYGDEGFTIHLQGKKDGRDYYVSKKTYSNASTWDLYEQMEKDLGTPEFVIHWAGKPISPGSTAEQSRLVHESCVRYLILKGKGSWHTINKRF